MARAGRSLRWRAALVAATALASTSGCTDTSYLAWIGDSATGTDAGFDATSGDGGGDSGPMDGGGTDTGTDAGDAGGSDAGWAGLGPFGPPSLMTINDPTAIDDDPSLTADLLELFFNSNRVGSVGGTDIWVATRATASDPWGTPTLVPVVNSIDAETTPRISSDGLTLWFASNRPGGMGLNDFYVSTRASRTATWSAPVPVPELSTPDSELQPAVDFSGLRMIISRVPAGGATQWDLFETSRPDLASPWATPTPITELNTVGTEANGHLSPSGLILIYDHDEMGTTDRNFYYVTRPNLSAPFGTPVAITEINSPFFDEDTWTSPDLRYIVFHSDRSGNSEIYEASR